MEKIFKEFRKNERVDLTNEQMINFFLYVIIFGLPYVYSPYGSDSYYFPKAIFLWIVGFILFILFIKEKDYKFNLSSKISIIFGITIFISTIFSLDRIQSLKGGEMRWEGLITILVYILLFILSSKYIRISKNIIKVFMILGAIMSVYGILQFYGIDSVPRDPFHETLKESYGFIGHRNFFSSYLIILLSISISTYIFYKKRSYFIYSLLYFAALISTMTRGGWMTLGVVCFIGLIFILKRKDCIKRAILILISFIIIFGVINYTKQGTVLNRFNTIKEDVTDYSDSSGSGRGAIWRASLYTIKKYPLLGSGPASLWNSFKKDLPEDDGWWWSNGYTIVDRVHNEYLNYAATSGIPSMIMYIFIILISMKNMLINIRDDKFKIMFLVILGYSVQAMFNISVVGVAPIFWIILGIASNPKIIKEIN